MSEPVSPSASSAPLPGDRRRRFQPRHAAYIVLLSVVAVCVYALYQLSDSPATNLEGGSIERLIPAPDSKILQQDQIGIDMAPGYEASLAVNGTPLPTDELLIVPPLNQVFYQPGPGKVIEFWPAGRNCIVATFWRSETGPNQSSSRAWCFSVV